MPYFCLLAHPQMPLVRATVEKKPRRETKDGFVLRLSIPIPEEWLEHADGVISELDTAMGKATKAHGVYQARYEAVLDAYRGLDRDPEPFDASPVLRPAALMLALGLTVGMCALLPGAILMFLFVTAFKKQSGFATMAEATILWSIFDWRPLIRKLLVYSKGGKWPK
jgi:hypothetical protein